MKIQHLTEVATRQGRVIRRRDFLRQLGVAGLAAGTMSWTDAIAASSEELRSRGMACILLWMQGGPSQFETFSPLPNHANGGETKAIGTNVSGIHIAENMPHCAKVVDDLAIIRSMTSKEGNHLRATYLLHHGYLPMGGVNFPTIGSHVAQQIGDAANQLPNYVRIGGRLPSSGGGGLLGVDYDPLVLQSAGRPPDNTKPLTDEDRYQRRLRLLNSLEGHFASAGGEQIVTDHRKLVQHASEMIMSPRMAAFDIEREPQTIRDAYGEGEFAAGCLMARRLVEKGVTFVEVVSKGWDTHFDGFNKVRDLTGQIDQPMATLITDLKQRGMLDETIIVFGSEFGRTPMAQGNGRDHHLAGFTMWFAGGGFKGGTSYGATDDFGYRAEVNRVSVHDVHATLLHQLGIDHMRFSIKSEGLDTRLTGVEPCRVVKELLV
jgi:hypothetical protein